MADCEMLYKRDGPKTLAAIHGPSGHKFRSSEKANAIADYVEIAFTPHD
jgi:hypothetical protein